MRSRDEAQNLADTAAQPPSQSPGGFTITLTRNAIWSVGLIVLLLVAGAAGRWAYVHWQHVVQERARTQYRSSLLAALRGANAPEAMQSAVDPDGVVLQTRDGWIAIRSVDNAPIPLAVAHDSGGAWWESNRVRQSPHHYRFWQAPRARARAENDSLWSEGGFLSAGINRELDQIEQSVDLTQARQRLQALGFREFTP